MRFLDKIAVLARKRTKDKDEDDAKKQATIRAIEKDMQAKLLDQSRIKLADALRRNLDRASPAYRRALLNFRKSWMDFYKFPLKIDQEERYLEVLREKDSL